MHTLVLNLNGKIPEKSFLKIFLSARNILCGV